MKIDIPKLWDEANSKVGCLSDLRQTTGRRKRPDTEELLRMQDDFRSDKARILSSKAYRTLAHKTQVFTVPRNCLIRTRLIHVGEVVACAGVIADMLGLNADLVEAAGFGHDMGHVPFGHQGEMWMAKTMGKPNFCHEVMAPIIAQKIERRGQGLNLCHETLDAMMRHSGNMAREGMTQEAWVLRHADKFTYIFHDYNDIVERMHYPIKPELRELVNLFGSSQRERTTTAIAGLVVESAELGRVSFEQSELGQKFQELRKKMYGVYVCVTQQNVSERLGCVLEFLSTLNIGDPFLLLALMTDEDVIRVSDRAMRDMCLFNETALSEIAPHLQAIGPIDLCDPGLDW